MTLSLARTTDRALNPLTAQIEPRTLVYAAILIIDGHLDVNGRPSQSLLVKGPALPYFPPISKDVRSLFDLEGYEMAKECAIALLVRKVEKLTHQEISRHAVDIEVWGGGPHVKDGIETPKMSEEGFGGKMVF
jgi:hypothetical protein